MTTPAETPPEQVQEDIANVVEAETPASWPSVFEEAISMLKDIRRMAKDGVLVNTDKDPEALQRISELPCSIWDILSIYQKNQETIVAKLDKETIDLYHYELKTLSLDRLQKEAFIVAFEDANSEEECVYGVSVHHTSKRVTVCFRGSVTTKDWIQDAKVLMVDIPNPVKHVSKEQQLPSKVGIHGGFKSYLYGEMPPSWTLEDALKMPSLGSIERNYQKHQKLANNSTKCQAILELVATVCANYPGYRLYMTGHSLGGALATLLAFEAAASKDDRIPKPVSLITVASPKVGNMAFRTSFECLEEQKLLRCLRVSNDLDVITFANHGLSQLPDAFCFRSVLFRHAGMNLVLSKRRVCGLRSPKSDLRRKHKIQGRFDSTQLLFQDLVDMTGNSLLTIAACSCYCVGLEAMAREHFCGEYRNRLVRHKEKLDTLYLNDFYNEKVKRGMYADSHLEC